MSTYTLGRYHIIREIARSNDIVYEAMDPALGRKIALKELQIPPNLAGKARHDRIQRFTREADATKRLHHPGVVRVFDAGQVEGRYFIAMEFLEGQSLRDVLRLRGALPAQEALRIATAVADALEYAHRQGVVHRDVKPDNVHLEPDGRVVLTDFGIARLTFEASLTMDGQNFGTPSYMSPEQVKGGEIDRRSDLFSLGVMLYEMLSGRKPFTGDSVITITYNIMNVEPPPLPGPQGVDAILKCALAKEPRLRYPSAADLAQDLRSLSQGQPAARALAIMPLGTGLRLGSAASLGAPVPVTRAPTPMTPTMMQPGPGSMAANGQAHPRPMPLPSPQPGASPGYVAAVPRQASRRDNNWAGFVAWVGVALVVGVLLVTVVWASVTAMDRTRERDEGAQVRQLRESAERAYGQRRYQDALSSYSSVAQKTTGKARLLAMRNAALSANELASEALNKNDLEAAEKYARAAVEADPNTIEGYVTLGMVHQKARRVDDAVAQWEKGVDQRESALQAGIELKQVDAAVARAADLKSALLYEEGLRLVQSGDLVKAEERFRGSVHASPRGQAGLASQGELAKLRATGQLPLSPPSGTTGPEPEPLPSGIVVEPSAPGWEKVPPIPTNPAP